MVWCGIWIGSCVDLRMPDRGALIGVRARNGTFIQLRDRLLKVLAMTSSNHRANMVNQYLATETIARIDMSI